MRFLFWIILIILVVVRFVATRPVYQEGQRIRLTTKVYTEPIRYSKVQGLTLENLKIYLPIFPEINYGDKVIIEGKVVKGELKEAKLVKVEETAGILYKLRRQIIDFYQKSIPEPHAALIAGITFGVKSGLPQDFWTSLKNTGTAHVVVASGMNVSLVAGFVLNFLIVFVRRRKAILLALIIVWIYAFMSGLEAPIARAAIMASISMIAQELGRVISAWRCLSLSAIIMLIVRPIWITDIGFILSFVATASLVLFQGRIEKKLKYIPVFLRESFSTTLAAQIGVAPILFVTFGSFNILSPLINVLVLWTIPLIMVIGAVAGLTGVVFPFLGRLVLYLAYPLTTWFTAIVRLFG